MEELKFLHFLDVGKVVTLPLQNHNAWAIEIVNHNSQVHHRSGKKIFFWEFVKYFRKYSISVGQCKGKNWNSYIFWMLEKLQGRHYKTKIAKPLKFLITIATFIMIQPKIAFENSLNTFENIAFLLGHCKWKNWNFYIFWMLEKL